MAVQELARHGELKNIIHASRILLGGPGESMRAEWLSLLEQTCDASIYLHPDVVDDDVLVYMKRERDALSALAVLAPRTLRMCRLPGLGRDLSLRGRRLVAGRILGARAEAEAFIERAVSLLQAGVFECLCFDDLDIDSPLRVAASRVASRGQVRLAPLGGSQPHWYIRFPEQPGDYWTQFSSKTRNTLRRKARKLEHRLVCYREPGDVPEFLARAHAISQRTWQTRRLGIRVRNSARERRLYTAIAERGALRSYVLEHQDQAVAFLIGIQYQDHFLYEEVGYHPELARCSPGTVLLYRVLQDLTANDCPRVVDFGEGDADYKRLFGNTERQSGPLVMVARRLRPSAVLALDRAIRFADRNLRALLRRIGLYRHVRRLYRRGD